MACTAIVCQAPTLGFTVKRGLSKPTGAVSAGLPLQQPFGWARHQSAVLASSSTLDAFDGWAPVTPFVRPDMADALDTHARPSRDLPKKDEEGKPHFRSALEQVSFETNNSLMEKAGVRKSKRASKGLLGRAAQLFGR